MAYWRFVSGNHRQRFAGAAGPRSAVYTPAENAMQQAAINRYFDERNAQPARFVWPLRPARAVAAYAGAIGGAATVNWLDSLALVMCSWLPCTPSVLW